MTPSDGRPCKLYDISVGEGAVPKEFLLVKQELVEPYPGKLSVLAGKRVYLAILTLQTLHL